MWKKVLFVCSCAALAACDLVIGSGREVLEDRDVPSFSSVEVRDGLSIEARIRPGKPEVSLSGDDNVLAVIETRVEGSRLIIEAEPSIDPVVPLNITVTAPTLESVAARSGSDAVVRDLDEDLVRLDESAGSNIVASGRVRRLVVWLSSGGDIDAGGVDAEEVDVDGSSGGSIAVRATREVRGVVRSGVDLVVFGAPQIREVRTESGADVSYE